MIELLFAITAVSLIAAAVSAAIAWTSVRENRRRSDARVARLAEVIYDADPPESSPVDLPHLLASVQAPAAAGRGRGVVAVVGVAAAVVAIVAIGRLGDAGATAQPLAAAQPAQPPGSRAATLELVSLVHERHPAGPLELRGQVHNLSNGATLEDVTAVALLFDAQGTFLASGRAPLDPQTLAAGADATFAITVADAARAARYRVSFRTRDRFIAHVDRRRDTEVSR